MFLDTPTGVPNHRRRDVLPLAAMTILRRPTGIAVGENPLPGSRQPPFYVASPGRHTPTLAGRSLRTAAGEAL